MLATRRFFSNSLKKSAKPWEAVKISYNDLIKPDSSSLIKENIERAYSKNGLGVVLVSDIPDFQKYNTRAAQLTNRISKLPKKELDSIDGGSNEHRNLVGWNVGTLEVDGVLDPAVASFWAYPNYGDQIPLYSETETVSSLWPKSLPEAQGIMKFTSEMMMDAMKNLGRHVDFYLDDKLKGKKPKSIENEIGNLNRNIHRLGYYFPPTIPDADVWLSFHTDFTIFTGLTPEVYFNQEGDIIDFQDPESGLFIMNTKTYEIGKINCPPDCLAIQAGEELQILSGGEIMATPHGVLPPGKGKPKVERAVYVLFTYAKKQTVLGIPEGKKEEDIYLKDDYPLYDYRHLRERWVVGEKEEDFWNRQASYFCKPSEELGLA